MHLEIKKESYLVVMEWEYIQEAEEKTKNLWYNSKVKKMLTTCRFFKGISKNTFVVLYVVQSFNEIQKIIESIEFDQFSKEIAPYMNSDFHQGVYGLVDVVLPRESFLPTTKYMQLRSIEVPLSGIDSYLQWRKDRIYKFVEKNDKVTSFLAFHSVLSTTPGVLFVTEYEGNPEEYRRSFLTPEYQQIIREAGHDHIRGGLNTFEYELVEM